MQSIIAAIIIIFTYLLTRTYFYFNVPEHVVDYLVNAWVFNEDRRNKLKKDTTKEFILFYLAVLVTTLFLLNGSALYVTLAVITISILHIKVRKKLTYKKPYAENNLFLKVANHQKDEFEWVNEFKLYLYDMYTTDLENEPLKGQECPLELHNTLMNTAEILNGSTVDVENERLNKKIHDNIEFLTFMLYNLNSQEDVDFMRMKKGVKIHNSFIKDMNSFNKELKQVVQIEANK